MIKTINIPKILKENKRRTAELDSPYDPILGIGSLIPRKELSYYDQGQKIEYHAPESMLKFPLVSMLNGSSVEELLSKTGGYSDQLMDDFRKEMFNLRLDHDFEFYCFTCVKIPDKITEAIIPFKLNRSQRRLIAKFEKMRLAGVPIRLILAKARQWGGSTATQIYMNWIQLRHKKRWNAAICTLVNPQAGHIRKMLETTIKNLPPELGIHTLSNYAGFANNKFLNERECIIGIGSVEKPENLRTYSIRMLHASEVRSWGSTVKKSGKDLLQTLRGGIPFLPDTMIVLESTAKGIGNVFHSEWLSATKEGSGYDHMFVPWFDIEIYRSKIEDYESFIKKLDSQYSSDGNTFWYLWELGATLEGIKWYMDYKKRENMDDLSMFQEFPSTSEEAFSSTGRPAFNPLHIKMHERTCVKPILIGDLNGESSKGPDAFKKIEFVANPGGNLFIWALPDKAKISNRYCGFADIGGKSKGADRSVVKIFDRYWMMEAGIPEVVAVWQGNIDQDLFGWKAAQLAYFYNTALLAVESNTYEHNAELSEGNHFLTVLDEIAPYYPNLYTRTNPEQVRQGVPNRYGFHTNTATKPLLVDTLNAALRDSLYMERDMRALDEMRVFEIKDNGTYGAKQGLHDDHVIATAGGLWLSTKYMDLPVEIKESNSTATKPIINETTF